MKSENNNPETVNVNPENVENAQTPEQAKAAAILRTRLPELTAAALNFEKRTGNFFTATTEQTDEGEKVRRLVQTDEDILKRAQNPDALAAEMQLKRHAAAVLSHDADATKAAENVAKAEAALAEAKAEAEAIETNYADALAAVMAYELPEKPAAERVTLKATVARQADELAAAAAELERLKALLASAGIEA